MKAKQLPILAVILTLMVSVAMAAGNKTSIRIDEPTMVGSVILQPGDYTVEWNGLGPDVQVSFLQGRQTITTVPGTLVAGQNPYNAVVTDAQESGTRLLVEIDTKTLAVHLSAAGVGGGK